MRLNAWVFFLFPFPVAFLFLSGSACVVNALGTWSLKTFNSSLLWLFLSFHFQVWPHVGKASEVNSHMPSFYMWMPVGFNSYCRDSASIPRGFPIPNKVRQIPLQTCWVFLSGYFPFLLQLAIREPLHQTFCSKVSIWRASESREKPTTSSPLLLSETEEKATSFSGRPAHIFIIIK